MVSQINEDVIPGMPFLARHNCIMNFTWPIVTIGEREQVCTDWFGRPMGSLVQTIRKTTITPRTKVALSCCLTSHNNTPERLIIALSDKVLLANSNNQSGAKGNVASTPLTNLWSWQQYSLLELSPASMNRA